MMTRHGVGLGRRTRASINGLLFLSLGLLGTACSYRSPSMVATPDLPPMERAPYRVRVADVLNVSFFKTTTLNQTRTIGPDGQIQLALIGSVEVVGRTLPELTEELTERYAEELVDPQLTMSIQEFSAMDVHVGGEVTQQGRVPYRGGLTIVQAIMDAGGFLGTARLSEVVLIRKGPDGLPVATVANVAQILRDAEFSDNVALAPMDIIYVPRSRIADVNKFTRDYIWNIVPLEYFYYFNAFRY